MTSTALVPIAEFDTQLVTRRDTYATVLGPSINVDRFMETVKQAVRKEPKLLKADRASLFEAVYKAANDHLPADGRFAAIVPFFDSKSKVTLAQYLPMVQGIQRRLRETGDVYSIDVQLIYEAHLALKLFRIVRAPMREVQLEDIPMGTKKGKMLGVVCIMRDKEERIIALDSMEIEEIEKARNVSRAKDSPAWKNWYGEMAKKTVIRRCAKLVATLSEEGRRIVEREDEYVDLDGNHDAATTNAVVRNLNDGAIEDLPALSMDEVAADERPAQEIVAESDPFAAAEGASLCERFAADLAKCLSEQDMQAVQERFKTEFAKLAEDAPEKKAAAASWNARRKFLASRQLEDA